MLSAVEVARAEVAAIAGLRAGRVRVACFRSAAATLLPPALSAMTRKHPGVSFTLVEAEPTRALEMLRDGACDVAVVYEYASPGMPRVGMSTTHLLDESVHVALPRSHPAAKDAAVSLRALRGDRWIAGCPNCRENLVRACAEVGYAPDIAFEIDDYVTLQGLAEAGLGSRSYPS